VLAVAAAGISTNWTRQERFATTRAWHQAGVACSTSRLAGVAGWDFSSRCKGKLAQHFLTVLLSTGMTSSRMQGAHSSGSSGKLLPEVVGGATSPAAVVAAGCGCF
jgi:hypothetical protein